ncbi:MAG: purine-nucleoside phosphorylase [Desulfobacteraceae bacterium]|nr:purine-nucleoside phosphorylase [Desulfobacteraceae bacterium]
MAALFLLSALFKAALYPAQMAPVLRVGIFCGQIARFLGIKIGNNMQTYKEKVAAAVDYLKPRIGCAPSVAIMTGSGLGESIDAMDVRASIDYADIPHFPRSTVRSHPGRLVSGTLAGIQALAMQGRLHLYEGYSSQTVAFPIRVMRMLGISTLILTNAAGGLNLAFHPGDIMVIEDHINLTGENPLAGPNEDDWGPRFPDMTAVYDKRLAGLARNAAISCGWEIRKGVYAGLKGPSLETSAETRFLRQIGADAVGFSTVQEAIAAVHAGIKIIGLSTITNINDPDNPTPDTEAGIVAVAQSAAIRMSAIIESVVKELAIS